MSAGRLGAYSLERSLGNGSLGPVWSCSDPETSRRVVLRIIDRKAYAREGLWPRLVEAVPALRSLEHPGVARIIGLVEDGDARAIVEEEVTGRTLADVLTAADGPLELDRFHAIFGDIVAALCHAREFELSHLRLNPSNVILELAPDGREWARVTGFGVGRAWGPKVDVESTLKADAQYLAPEQWHDLLPVGPMTDVYAVGVMMYEALTMQVPFAGDSVEAISRGHLEDELRPPADVDPSIPWELDAAIRAVLVRHPADRINTAGDLEILLAGARCKAVLSLDEVRSLTPGSLSGPVTKVRPSAGPRRGSLEYTEGFADTAEHALDAATDRDRPGGGFHDEGTLPATPVADFTGEGTGDTPGPFVYDPSTMDPGNLEVPTAVMEAHKFSTARTGPTEIPDALAGVDLAGREPTLTAEQTEAMGNATTSAVDIPIALQDVPLLDENGQTDASDQSEEALGNAETEAVTIPEHLRGIDLGGDD